MRSSGDSKGISPPAAVAKRDDQALVRFVNGTTASKNLGFGEAVPFDRVEPANITAYKELPAERNEFKLFNGGRTDTLTSNTEGLSAGKHYTILAVLKNDGGITLASVTDHLIPPSPGMLKVRVMNLAPALQEVSLYISGNRSPFVKGLGLDDATDYRETAPSKATLYGRKSKANDSSFAIGNAMLTAGKLYSLLVFQDKSGEPLVKTIEDKFMGPQL